MTILKHTTSTFKFGLGVAAAALISVSTATGQVPTLQSASYSGDMMIDSGQGETLNTKIYAMPYKHRTEMFTETGVMVSIIDMQAQDAYTFAKDINGPLGNQAMKIDYSQAAKQMGVNVNDQPNLVKTGQSVVAGQVCNIYQTDEGSACITGDGIMLRALPSDGGRMEMMSLSRGAQPDSLFRIPAGYNVIDMSALAAGSMGFGAIGTAMGGQQSTPAGTNSDNAVQGFLQDQAHKQTKSQVKKAAKKELGNSIGGAIGGGILGSTVGNEAGKAASDLVGGLFGKKKKKKKDKEKKEAE